MRPLTALALAAVAATTACTQIDCPVDNTVATVYQLLKADGTPDTLKADTLTITTIRRDGGDTTLVNRLTNATTMQLPISSGALADTLFFTLSDTTGTQRRSTVVVEKTDMPHFESVDCAMSHFHTLNAITATGEAIDSITISKKTVDYDLNTPHISLYLNHGR